MRTVLLLTLFISWKGCYSQSMDSLHFFLKEKIGYSSGLYIGTKYEGNFYKNSHPFFQQKTWRKSRIRYRNQEYNSVNSLFDLQQNKVIIGRSLKGSTEYIQLFKEDIQLYEVDGLTFVPKTIEGELVLVSEIRNTSILNLFEYLYKAEEVSWDGRYVELVLKTKAFIEFKGQLYPATRQSFFSLFPNDKVKLRKAIKAERVNFKEPSTIEPLIEILTNVE